MYLLPAASPDSRHPAGWDAEASHRRGECKTKPAEPGLAKADRQLRAPGPPGPAAGAAGCRGARGLRQPRVCAGVGAGGERPSSRQRGLWLEPGVSPAEIQSSQQRVSGSTGLTIITTF